jgi:hypothetical protein
MPNTEEPSYLAFARDAIRRDNRVSPTIARELVARIDRDAAALKAAATLPVRYPDRDELAFALFAADNYIEKSEQIRADYDRLRVEQAAAGEHFYVDLLADAAIEAFKRANQ